MGEKKEGGERGKGEKAIYTTYVRTVNEGSEEGERQGEGGR